MPPPSQRIARAAQLQVILDLASRGAAIDEIAITLNVSEEKVRKALMKEDRRDGEVTTHVRMRYRTIVLQRLEALWSGLRREAISGDPKSVRAALGVLERQCRLLGLDEPTRTSVDAYVTQRLEPDLSIYTTSELEEVELRLAAEVHEIKQDSEK